MGLIEQYQAWRQSKAQPAEPSPELRQLLFIGQLASMLGLTLTAGPLMWPFGAVFSAVLYFGQRYSRRNCEAPLKRVRQAIFIGLHVAFLYMMIGIAIGLPYPQGQMAMLCTALVSWEMFSRRNLYVGWLFALANLHVTATLSRGYLFFVPLIVVGATFLTFLWVIERLRVTRAGYEILGPVHTDRPHPVWGTLRPVLGERWVGRFAGTLFLLGLLFFVGIPRIAGAPIVPPFTLRIPMQGGPSGQIINPAIPIVQVQGVALENENSDYYHGFDSRLDLSYRGGLSEAVMLYVRSPARSYWRSHAYDYYDGRSWTQSRDEAEDVEIIRKPVASPSFTLDSDPPAGNRFVQTFYVVRPLPNLAFVGGSPVELYLPAEEIAVDSTGGIRLAETLEPGMSYSVLSVSTQHGAGELRDARWAGSTAPYPADIMDRYLQLPETVTTRTVELAASLTADLPTVYDQVKAIETHLKESYPYDFYPPPQKPNSDSVDQFLFVDQTGYCEHYVSAMVVMLRSQGIPARLVSGFGSGRYDFVNNLYEVRARDAHSWVEVYFPGKGWVPFEPTPGWNRSPQTDPVRNWALSGLTAGLNLPVIPFSAVAQAFTIVGSVLLTPLLIIAALVGLYFAGRRLSRLWQTRQAASPPTYSSLSGSLTGNRRRILRRYTRWQRQNRSWRGTAETVQQHAVKRESEALPRPLADLVDIAAYRPVAPTEEELQISQ